MRELLENSAASLSPDRLLTAEEVSLVIGMTPQYVYALARRNGIPVIRFGRTVRFRRGSVEEWLSTLERR